MGAACSGLPHATFLWDQVAAADWLVNVSVVLAMLTVRNVMSVPVLQEFLGTFSAAQMLLPCHPAPSH